MGKKEAAGMANASGITFGELIRRQRKAKNMKQEELGALVRVGKNAVGAWEAGRSRPDVANVPVICEALGLTLEEFFGLPPEEEKTDPAACIRPEEREKLFSGYTRLNTYNRQVVLRQISMLNEMQEDIIRPRKVIRLFRNDLAASAGPGETLEATRGEPAFLFADPRTETADEIVRVNGDSMEPTYSDGELVLIRHSSTIRPGEVGVFIIGDSGYIKEFRRDGLHSHNHDYATIAFSDGDEVHCIGKVLGKVREDDWSDEESYRNWQEYERKGK